MIKVKRKTIHFALAGALALATGVTVTTLLPTSAKAFVVFDPWNYGQNLLTAARSLEEIQNQIKQLTNEAESLAKMDLNLAQLGSSIGGDLKSQMNDIKSLLDKANGIALSVAATDSEMKKLFPTDYAHALTNDQSLAQAKTTAESGKHLRQVRNQAGGGIGGGAVMKDLLASVGQDDGDRAKWRCDDPATLHAVAQIDLSFFHDFLVVLAGRKYLDGHERQFGATDLIVTVIRDFARVNADVRSIVRAGDRESQFAVDRELCLAAELQDEIRLHSTVVAAWHRLASFLLVGLRTCPHGDWHGGKVTEAGCEANAIFLSLLSSRLSPTAKCRTPAA